ncbi:MAG: hypothetical protein ABI276_06440 [Acidimicrobiales bacterium]
MVVAAVVWTFWIDVVIVLATAGLILAVIVGFFVKSLSIKYPPGEVQRRVQDALRRR